MAAPAASGPTTLESSTTLMPEDDGVDFAHQDQAAQDAADETSSRMRRIGTVLTQSGASLVGMQIGVICAGVTVSTLAATGGLVLATSLVIVGLYLVAVSYKGKPPKEIACHVLKHAALAIATCAIYAFSIYCGVTSQGSNLKIAGACVASVYGLGLFCLQKYLECRARPVELQSGTQSYSAVSTTEE